MKIVFLHNDFKVYWQGRLYFLHHFFAQKNIQLHVIEIFGGQSSYSFDKTENNKDWWDCLFETQQFSELSQTEVTKKIMDRLDEINPDFLVCGPIAFTSGAIGMRWAYKRKKKVVLFDDAKHSLYKRNFLVNYIKINLTKLAYGILVPSPDYDLEYSKWKINKNQLYYGLNCIDNAFFSSKRKQKFSNSKKIVCVARLVPIKNLESLFQSWKTIEENNPDYQLIIIGDGPEYDHLVEMKNSLGLDRLRLLGNQSRPIIAKILSQSDVFILPSFLEGWAMVVNEAMAAGLPVLLSDRINAGHTLLDHGKNGFSFDPYSKEQITTTILNYINLSDEDKKKLSKNAISEIKKYDYTYLGNQLLRAINDLDPLKTKTISVFNYPLLALWNGKFKTANWDTLK